MSFKIFPLMMALDILLNMTALFYILLLWENKFHRCLKIKDKVDLVSICHVRYRTRFSVSKKSVWVSCLRISAESQVNYVYCVLNTPDARFWVGKGELNKDRGNKCHYFFSKLSEIHELENWNFSKAFYTLFCFLKQSTMPKIIVPFSVVSFINRTMRDT